MGRLICQDHNRIDQWVILKHSLDFAFGTDENDFVLTLQDNNPVCKYIQENWFIYVDGTEYGGIIDKKNPNSANKTLSYVGRTIHGIMNAKILCPDAGQDYLIVSGNANTVIGSLLTRLGLLDLFKASSDVSAINIGQFQFERYVGLYEGLLTMLYTNNAKLNIELVDGYYVLSAVPLYNWSKDEEWDTRKTTFSITKTYNHTNHMICLGTGNLKDRYVIHLFANENRGIMAYSVSDAPYKDSQYILDTSQQKIFGRDEIAYVYDYSNAKDTENYVLLSVQPSDWPTKYANYYTKSSNGYDVVTYVETIAYSVQTSVPSDWASNYAKYFKLSGTDYKAVEGAESAAYTLQAALPDNWTDNYGDYFYYYSDGVTSSYKSVSGISIDNFLPQTEQPTDWLTNWKSYYKNETVYQYTYRVKTKQSNGTWKTTVKTFSERQKNTDTVKYSHERKMVKEYTKATADDVTAPKWELGKYYTNKLYTVAPTWVVNSFYTKVVSTVAPTWAASTYYTKSTAQVPPVFKTGTYYQLFVDHYADLVAYGIKKFKELLSCDTITCTLKSDSTIYDVNDIVGATDINTGITVSDRIIKKIVKYENGVESIEYKIGE